jgi:phage shock protein PspC (stress-responsive transcriptional regulator)
MAKTWFTGVIASIESWASGSHERVQLLMLLIWVAFGIIALAIIAIIAVIMLPPAPGPL